MSVVKYRMMSKLELMHGDLCGLVMAAIPSGRKYFFLLVDNLSRYMLLVLLTMKSEALVVFTAFQKRAEAEARRKLGKLRTDRGGEFMGANFINNYTKQGVQWHLTAPYTSEQNRVVERRNQTVMGMARSMLKAMCMPSWLWGNRSPRLFSS
jgi:transposase InsO family protein